MAIYGYARVSTNGQSLGDQIAALRAAGATMIYKEKVSGIRADRPQLAKMIKALGAGDMVVVSRLDRLARSTRDLLNIVDAIAKAGASFKSLADAWADTTTPHGKLMLTVLGGLAEFEHSLIKARTDAGRERAKAAGVRFGPQAQARCLSTGRGAQAAGGWRGHERRCQELSRERADDLAAAGGSVMSNKPLPKNSVSMPMSGPERTSTRRPSSSSPTPPESNDNMFSTGLSAPVTIDCATKAFDMCHSRSPAHRHDTVRSVRVRAIPSPWSSPRTRHPPSPAKYRIALNAQSLQQRRPGCAGIPRADAGRRLLPLPQIACTKSARSAASAFRYSLEHVRRALTHLVRLRGQYQGPPAFLLFVRGTTK